MLKNALDTGILGLIRLEKVGYVLTLVMKSFRWFVQTTEALLYPKSWNALKTLNSNESDRVWQLVLDGFDGVFVRTCSQEFLPLNELGVNVDFELAKEKSLSWVSPRQQLDKKRQDERGEPFERRPLPVIGFSICRWPSWIKETK